MFTCVSFVYIIFGASRGVFRIFLVEIENNGTQPRCAKQLKPYSASKKVNRSVPPCKICPGSTIYGIFAVQLAVLANHLRANTAFQFFKAQLCLNRFMHLHFVPFYLFAKTHVSFG